MARFQNNPDFIGVIYHSEYFVRVCSSYVKGSVFLGGFMAEQTKVITAAGAVTVPASLEAAQAALASMKIENTVLRNELKKSDGVIANRDLQDFASVIPAESEGFWRKQFLANRSEAIATLQGLVAAKTAAPVSVVPPAPLHNRNTARPVPPAVLAGSSGADDGKGMKIRNRAHEICAAERVPFSVAFRRAEAELAG